MTSNETAIAELRLLGAPEEVIQSLIDDEADEDFEVFPENWSYVDMFVRLGTQWRASAVGAVGLDYSVAKWFFDVYHVEDHETMIAALQCMEHAALATWAEEHGK